MWVCGESVVKEQRERKVRKRSEKWDSDLEVREWQKMRDETEWRQRNVQSRDFDEWQCHWE